MVSSYQCQLDNLKFDAAGIDEVRVLQNSFTTHIPSSLYANIDNFRHRG